jgi:hypothetical protein
MTEQIIIASLGVKKKINLESTSINCNVLNLIKNERPTRGYSSDGSKLVIFAVF